MSSQPPILLLTRSEIACLLTLDDHIAAVEGAFRAHALGEVLPPGLMHVDAHSGEFHIKAGGVTNPKAYFALKANGGFFHNMSRYGLPNIQGLVLLYDAEKGSPLAVMDSIEITKKRTGAATAVAARHLAAPDASTAVICGSGNQARIQLESLARVRPLKKVFVYSNDEPGARVFAKEMSAKLSLDVAHVGDLRGALAQSQVCITCTPSKHWFLAADDVPPGMFVSAVGADSPEKQELEPKLVAQSKLVCDILDQCANVGEFHHAIAAGLATRSHCYAQLGEVLAGLKPGRTSDEEVIVFDSTGTALQDVASAAAAYERALATGVGTQFDIFA
ncbi:MAG: ornithine cyclodeaminase family protein [Bryobacteraceae bacterium]